MDLSPSGARVLHLDEHAQSWDSEIWSVCAVAQLRKSVLVDDVLEHRTGG